jgi:hypothetical protein
LQLLDRVVFGDGKRHISDSVKNRPFPDCISRSSSSSINCDFPCSDDIPMHDIESDGLDEEKRSLKDSIIVNGPSSLAPQLPSLQWRQRSITCQECQMQHCESVYFFAESHSSMINFDGPGLLRYSFCSPFCMTQFQSKYFK